MEVIEKKSLLNSIELIQDAFLESRKAANQALLQQGLPTSKSEEYKFTPITRQLENTFTSLQASKKPSSLNIDEFLVPELDANVLVFVNGQLDTRYSRINSSDFILKDLSEAIQENNKEVETYFSKYAASEADPFIALNTSTWNHGVFIHVKENVIIQKPLIIHSIADASNGNIILAARNLILLEKNAHISVIEKYDSVGDSTFSTGVNEVIVKENANFTFKLIQNDAGNRVQVNHTTIHQEKNSLVNCFALSLNGKLIRNNLHLIIDGEGVDTHMNGLYLLQGDTLVDNHTVVDHKKPHSQSNELYKGVMDDRAKGVFNGKIYVRPDAQKTNAFQSNRNILLSDTSTINTKPQLEIWADDVKCSHGCTTGQLDEESLFYLRSRGIDKKSAKALLLYAFAGEVISKISNISLREYIDKLVSKRLQNLG